MRFFNIKHDGIFMEQGNLFLKESYFNNCVGNGINIKKILNVNISDGCNFTWDSNLQFQSPNNTNYYNGINLQGSLVGGSCKISHNYFHANVNSILQEIAGVNFTSNDFSGNSTTNINDNNFKLSTSRFSNAINLRTYSSSNSSFRIIGNFFDLTANSNSTGRPYGIFSTGKRDNLEVVGNTFYNIPPNFYLPIGISIQGSDNGNNNFIAENHFTSGLSDLSLYLLSNNYCSYYFALEIGFVA